MFHPKDILMPPPPVFLLYPSGADTTPLFALLRTGVDVDVLDSAHVTAPLAHLGYYYNVDKAPYDHVLAVGSQRLFVDQLPRKEEDYIRACRAYCDTLYERRLAATGKRLIVDGSGNQAMITPFLLRVFRDARFVIYLENPVAALARDDETPPDIHARGWANMARIVAENPAAYLVVRGEEIGNTPTEIAEQLSQFLETSLSVPEDADGVDDAWMDSVTRDPVRLRALQRAMAYLDPGRLAALGYTPGQIWHDLEERAGRSLAPAPNPVLDLQRALVTALRPAVRRPGPLNTLANRVRLACDVLLRE